MLALLVAREAAALPAGCEADHDLAHLHATLGEAEAALQALDDARLGHAMEAAHDSLRCAREPVPAPDLVRFHAAVAVLAFTRGELPRTIDEFQAVRLLDPSWVPPDSLGAAIADTFAQVPLPAGDTVALRPPPTGALWVGGRPGLNRPTEAPTYVQWLAADGTVTRNWLLEPNDAAPSYVEPVAPAPAPVVPSQRSVLEAERRPSRGLLLAGLAVGAAGVGAGAGAAALKGRYLDPDKTLPESDPRTVNHVLGYGAYALLAGGAGLVGGAVIAGRW